MNKRFGLVKISTLLVVTHGILFVMLGVGTILLVRYSMRQQALAEAEDKMRLILDRNMAVHTYFSQILKPDLFAWSEPFRSADYFDPSWMSSTYAIRVIGNYFKMLNPADYYYKDAVINARSPENEADAEERAFIEELKINPLLQERSSIQMIDGKPYLVVMQPGEVLEESCLLCHGAPQDAPGDLVRQYGDERSFHREAELGSVVSVISVRVPLAAAYTAADHLSLQLSALLLTLLGLLFIVLVWLPRRLVFAPLAGLYDKALEIATHDEHLGEQIPVPFGAEIGALTRAFNTMSDKLRESRDQMETRVRERTENLERSEEALRREKDFTDSLIDTAQVIVLVLDTQGRIVRFNPYMEEISGYTLAEVQGKDWFDTLLPERNRESTRNLFQKALADIQTHGYIDLIMTKDGRERQIEWYDKTLKDVQENVIGLLSTGRDVTERKQREEQLLATQVEMQQLLAEAGQSRLALLSVVEDFQQSQKTLLENEQKVRRLLEQQLSINQLALALGESVNLGEIYHIICTRLRGLVDVWCFIISSYDEQTKLIRADYAESDQVYDVSEFPPIPLGEPNQGTQSRVIHTGQPLYSPDHRRTVEASKTRYTIEEDGSVHEELPSEVEEEKTTRSAVYLPMKVKGKVMGIMQVQSTRLDAYSEEDITMLAGMANVAAVAIQNARLHEDVLRELTDRKRAEEEIQNLAKFPAEDPHPILRVARDGTLLYSNEAASRLLDQWQLQPGQTVPAMLLEPILQSLNSGTVQTIEREHGKRVFAFTVAPIVDVGYANLYGHDITERLCAVQELEQSRQQLRALTSYWQTAIEAERATIAREIHDDFGQSMTALKMDLTWLVNRLPEGDERVERIRGMNILVDDSIALMRRIATDLRPNLLDDLGLNAALEWQAREFSRRSGIPCKLDLPKVDLALDQALSTTLFRIFQETLTNVNRHAQATQVDVDLRQEDQILILIVRDNGRGITQGELNDPHSLGLLGLRERTAQWNGELIIRGAPGESTTVTVRIPLPASPDIGEHQ